MADVQGSIGEYIHTPITSLKGEVGRNVESLWIGEAVKIAEMVEIEDKALIDLSRKTTIGLDPPNDLA